MRLEDVDPKDLSLTTVPVSEGFFLRNTGAKITHTPSGLSATCTEERSTHLNAQRATAELSALLLDWEPGEPKAGIESIIPQGWMFLAADFSLKAKGHTDTGSVTLIRDKVGREEWYKLDEEGMIATKLYQTGTGRTIEEALADAAMKAVL